MLRKLTNCLLASVIATTAVVPAQAAADPVYWFRHNSPATNVERPPVEQGKDITAFFSGAVGFEFRERLPMRSDWEDDAWSVVGGTLPAGIVFDPVTRTFRGTPTVAVTAQSVDLVGRDRAGRNVATAKATFDVYAIEGQSFFPKIYAHTGKYKFDQLQVPTDVTIQSWNVRENLPDGVQIIGRNLDGTPETSGKTNFFMQGLDYTGQVVATYIGNYEVEDGPGFDPVADDVRVLAGNEHFRLTPPAIRKAINGDLSKVRYYLEVEDGDRLQGSLVSNAQPRSLVVEGYVTSPYDTAKVRWKAIDTDDTAGYSNWFTIGSGDPQLACAPAGTPLQWLTGVDIDTAITPPTGSAGSMSYAISSGTLPDGVRLDADGHFRGRVMTASAASPLTVTASSTTDGTTVNVECGFTVTVQNAFFALKNLDAGQAAHVRAGASFEAKVSVEGGIPDYEVALDGEYPTLSITSPTRNTPAITVGGTLDQPGLPFNIALSALNGDGNRITGAVPMYVYGPLSFGQDAVPVFVKRLAPAADWGAVGYDATTVIPDVGGAMPQPTMALAGGPLPAGITFGSQTSPYGFRGTTAAAVGTYGPYTVTMKDFSGDTVVSTPFTVNVTERDPMTAGAVTAPTFVVEGPKEIRTRVFEVVQPEGAKDFELSYSLNGPSLPSGVSFDAETGEVVGEADLKRDVIGSYGPYTVTVTDTEGASVTSAPFEIGVNDWPLPSAAVAAAMRASVAGTGDGENTTSVSSGSLANYVHPQTVFGGIEAVSFTGIEPASPAGLTFASGVLSGTPTSEYTGDVVATFEDARGRTGSVTIPLDIKAYPVVDMETSSFEVPRLAQAVGYGVTPTMKSGFWTGRPVSWSLAAGTLPEGMSVDAMTGAVIGRTTAAAGTTASGLRIKATTSDPAGNTLVASTRPFSIAVGERAEIELSYPISGADKLTYKLSYDANRVPRYALDQGPLPGYSVNVGGSYEPTLDFSIPVMPEGLVGIGVNHADGFLTGFPSGLGEWVVPITVKDGEGASADTEVTLKATLSGNIVLENAEDTTKTLRVGEPFAYPQNMQPIVARNAVGNVVYSTVPALLPEGVAGNFSGATGVFSDDSHIATAGNRVEDIWISVKDSDGRTSAKQVLLRLNVVDRLGFNTTQTSWSATQFTGPLNVALPAAENGIGKVAYSLSGDVPGVLVFKNYDADGVLKSFQWTDTGTGVAHELHVTAAGVATRHERSSGGDQALVGTSVTENLPLDAIVFDPLARTLVGVPSKSGSFELALKAVDDHKDKYIKSATTRQSYNEASMSFTVSVAAAPAMTVANSASSETLQQYTKPATVTSLVANAAYGRPVTWRKVAGTLPQGVSATASTAGNTLVYSGYPETTGTFADIRYIARDAAGREVETQAMTFAVQARQPLIAEADANPAGFVVNEAGQSVRIVAKGVPYGALPVEGDWTVTGASALPTGMTAAFENGGITVSGTPTTVGNYGPVTVRVQDSKGGSSTVSLTFEIISPTDAITLDVADVRTKVDAPVTITPVAGNTYGTPRFRSDEIAGAYSGNLSLASNGTITGSFPTTGLRTVNLAVGDQTTRLTSKAIKIEVIPDIAVTVATQTTVKQAEQLSREIDTINKIGTVSYAKGAGTWPEGVSVDDETGRIMNTNAQDGVVAAVGTYSGLTIKATDTFTGGTDVGYSNPFSIIVEEIEADPVIADFTGKQIFTLGTEVSFKPTVTDSVKGKPWNLAGTTYSLNRALPAGLDFDSKTGLISGTPSEAAIIRDLVITVTAQSGASDATAPFWFGVQPNVPITARAGQKSLFVVRTDQAYSLTAPVFDDAMGNLSYVALLGYGSGDVVDQNTGVQSNPNLPQAAYTGTTSQRNFRTRITDEFGRQAEFPFQLRIVYPMWQTPTTVEMVAGTAYVNHGAPTVNNIYGTATYQYSGLPAGISGNTATGALSGTLSATAAAETTVTMTVTDSFDGSVATMTRVIRKAEGYLYYRLNDSVTSTSGHYVPGQYWGMLKLFDKNGVDVAALGRAEVAGYISSPNVWSTTTDSNPNRVFDTETRTGMIFGNDPSGVKYIGVKFKQPTVINSAFLSLAEGTAGDNAWVMQYFGNIPVNYRIEASQDGVNWVTKYTGSFSGPNGAGRTQWNQTVTLATP